MRLGGRRLALERFVRLVAGDAGWNMLDPSLRARMLSSAETYLEIEIGRFDTYLPDASALARIGTPIQLVVSDRSPPYFARKTTDDSVGDNVGSWPSQLSCIARVSLQWLQSTATSSAAQICRMRWSLSRPMRSTSTPTETLSTESRLTALRRGIGSSPGSRTTSLARPRIVVVHGATSARPSRGIAASRDSTMTGRRAI
jgi:hypothetical protein